MFCRHFSFTSVLIFSGCSFLLPFPTTAQAALAVPLQSEQALETAIDDAGAALGEALNQLSESLDQSAEKMGRQVEDWAEENSEELEQWSSKYANQWEAWAKRLEQTMELTARDQEAEFKRWAERYEKSWQEWSDKMESADLDSKMVGELVQQNLKMLSELPLEKLVDQTLKQSLRELSSAPWESLDELGALAEKAIEQPLQELQALTEQNSQRPESRATTLQPKQNEKQIQFDAKVRALENLLKREDLTEKKSQAIKRALAELKDTQTMLNNELAEQSERAAADWSKNDRGRVIEQPQRESPVSEEQILARLKAERTRHELSVKELEQTLIKIRKKRELEQAAQASAAQDEARSKSKERAEIERLKREIESLRRQLKQNGQ